MTIEDARPGATARRERAVLFTLAAVQFTNIVDFMVVMPLGPQLMRRLHITPGQFGLIVASYTVSAGVAGLFAASWADRFGRKAAFLVLYAGFLAGTLCCGLAPGFATLLAARVVTGAFGGVLGAMALAIIGDVFPRERIGAATGALMTAFALASIVGVPFGLSLGARYDWHAPFLALAALGLPFWFAASWALPTLRGHLDPARSPASPLAEIGATLAHPNHLLAFGLIGSLMLGSFAVIPYISSYLVSNVGISERGELPWVYVAGGVLSLVGAPAIGRLADRFGRLLVYRIAAPSAAALMLAVTLLPRVTPWAAIGLVGVMMLANAGRMVAAMAMVQAGVEPERRGSFQGANSAVQHLASGLGSYVGGLLIVEAADRTLLHFDRVGWFALACTLASLGFAAKLRVAGAVRPTSTGFALAAAAESEADPGGPLPTT